MHCSESHSSGSHLDSSGHPVDSVVLDFECGSVIPFPIRSNREDVRHQMVVTRETRDQDRYPKEYTLMDLREMLYDAT